MKKTNGTDHHFTDSYPIDGSANNCVDTIGENHLGIDLNRFLYITPHFTICAV
jgi:hypothetical protein